MPAMPRSLVLALDQGTTSSRALVFDATGTCLGLAQREHRQHYPHPGWVEHDPAEIWANQLAVARAALAQANVTARDLAGIGITNQRETLVAWDRATGEPVTPAIVWQDRRTADHCARLQADGHGELVRGRTGLVLDPYFSGTKLRWMLDHVSGLAARAARGQIAVGTIDSWLAWKLTGGARHVTDASNASRTMLYDIHAGTWSAELAALLGVPLEVLPEVRGTSEVVGESQREHLGACVPVAALVGDQQAALFGQQCLLPGAAKTTYGTGCFMLMNTGTAAVESRHGLLTTVAWRLGDRLTYALEGSVFIAGAAINWLRDGLGVIADAAEIDALAGSVADAGDCVFVPAFAGLGAPHWDATARGLVIGISGGTTRAHLARATLDAIACQVAELAHAMRADAGIARLSMRVDGGASASDALMQLTSDLVQGPLHRPAQRESTALGAAMLAGLATGVWSSTDALAVCCPVARSFAPSIDGSEAARRLATWSRAVERARGWAAAGTR